MKRSILKLEAVGNSGLISTSRAIIKTQQNQAISNGHLTDRPKVKPPMERDDFYNSELIEMATKTLTRRNKGIRQTSTAYTLSGGAANVGVEEVRQTETEQMKVIHTLPVMTDAERNVAKKRIGSDLYEIFMRIQAELCLDNENLQK